MSAHMRGILLYYPTPRRSDDRHPPAKGGGHSSMSLLEHSLTTPGYAHPSNGGELVPRRDEGQVPLCGGVGALRDGVVYSIAHACSNSYVPVASV